MIAVHIENKQVAIRAKPRPRRPKGYALIRLLCGGICNTDLELQRGYYKFRGTPGHEFVGKVVAADNVRLVGRRVVGEINLPCGRCPWCKRGLGRHCPARTVLGIVRQPGAFSDFFLLPEQNLHPLPESIPTESAVFAEPLAAACEILEQVRIPRQDSVAVMGDGKLGLLIAQVLHLYGAKIHLYGRHEKKLQIAEEAGIATRSAQRHLPVAAYDWVVEATGAQTGLSQAIQMVRPRGTIILKSTVHGSVDVDTAPVIVNEITLIGSRCGPFGPALQLLESGAIQVEKMISARFPLSEAPRAFAEAASKDAIKVLLFPD